MNKHVFGFHVAMHDGGPVAVGMTETGAKLPGDLPHGLGGERHVLVTHQGPKRSAGQQFHEEKWRSVLQRPAVPHPHDVRVPQPGHHFDFVFEAIFELAMAREVGMQDFHRGPEVSPLADFVDGSHAAFSKDSAQDPVGAWHSLAHAILGRQCRLHDPVPPNRGPPLARRDGHCCTTIGGGGRRLRRGRPRQCLVHDGRRLDTHPK